MTDGPVPQPGGPAPAPASVDVVVEDDQDAQPVDLDRWTALVHAVVADLVTVAPGGVEVTVQFVDDDRIAELNRDHLGGDGPTDVLSFPIDGEQVGGLAADHARVDDQRGGDGPPLLLGDVVICPAVAARNAPDHAGTYDDELALLLVHGVLHLLGHDHAEPDDEAAMQALERRLLDRHHRSAGSPTR